MKRILVTGTVVSVLGMGLVVVLLVVLGAAAARPVPVRAQGSVITVCREWECHYDNIQAAVDAAFAGDEIRVAGGTYTGVHSFSGVTQVVYVSKTLTIRGGYSPDLSVWDPDTYSTTVDAEMMGRGFYLGGDVTPTLEALSITGGSGVAGGGGSDAGGGIYIQDAHPTISGCLVYSNTGGSGAGVRFYGSSNVTLIGNRILNNVATGGNGGGVYAYSGDNAALTGNQIYGNRANNGGGLYMGNSDGVSLFGNEIYSNTTPGNGGGMLISSSDDLDLSYNLVYSNTSTGSGGGLSLHVGTGTMTGNQFTYNTVSGSGNGGGIYLDRSDIQSDGDIIRWNRTVSGEGSGISMFESSPVLSNTVVADNVDEGAGAGARIAIYVDSASPRFLHLTMARHPGNGLYIVSYGSLNSSVTVSNSIVYSHSVGVFVYALHPKISSVALSNTLAYSNTMLFANDGNTIEDDSGTIFGDPDFMADGVHIGPNSAAIDAGLDAGVLTDVDGDPRPVGGGYDIGADERPQEIYLPLVVRQWP